MSKTIKVIDLLNRIAKKENLPKSLRFRGRNYNLAKERRLYKLYLYR